MARRNPEMNPEDQASRGQKDFSDQQNFNYPGNIGEVKDWLESTKGPFFKTGKFFKPEGEEFKSLVESINEAIEKDCGDVDRNRINELRPTSALMDKVLNLQAFLIKVGVKVK